MGSYDASKMKTVLTIDLSEGRTCLQPPHTRVDPLRHFASEETVADPARKREVPLRTVVGDPLRGMIGRVA
jgi:hypothetical protein